MITIYTKKLFQIGITTLIMLGMIVINPATEITAQKVFDLHENNNAIINNNIRLFKEYWAIIIGINNYPGTTVDLPWSVNEVTCFKNTLLDGGNWKEDHIKLLTDSNANKSNIFSAIEWLDSNEDFNDVSIIYFAGHGSRNLTNYFISVYGSKISDEELNNNLDNLEGRVIVILDACFSGGFIEKLKDRKRVIITACEKNEATYQDSNLKSGFLGYFLNLSLRRFTKTAELTFILARPLIVGYSKKVSEEYGEDYTVNPKMYDGAFRFTKIIRNHFRMWFKSISKIINEIKIDTSKKIWKM